MAPPKTGTHFLHLDDFSKEELVHMLQTAKEVKQVVKAGDQSFKPFKGKTLAMIFTKPSMRTRVSFETVGGVGLGAPRVGRGLLAVMTAWRGTNADPAAFAWPLHRPGPAAARR